MQIEREREPPDRVTALKSKYRPGSRESIESGEGAESRARPMAVGGGPEAVRQFYS